MPGGSQVVQAILLLGEAQELARVAGELLRRVIDGRRLRGTGCRNDRKTQ